MQMTCGLRSNPAGGSRLLVNSSKRPLCLLSGAVLCRYKGINDKGEFFDEPGMVLMRTVTASSRFQKTKPNAWQISGKGDFEFRKLIKDEYLKLTNSICIECSELHQRNVHHVVEGVATACPATRDAIRKEQYVLRSALLCCPVLTLNQGILFGQLGFIGILRRKI